MYDDSLNRLAAALLDVARQRDPEFVEPDDDGDLSPLAEPGNISIQVGRVIYCNERGKVLKIAEHAGRTRVWVLEEGGPIDLGDAPAAKSGDPPPFRPEQN
jgi:hypothetical protein